MFRIAFIGLFALCAPLAATAQDSGAGGDTVPGSKNAVCGPDVSAGQFKLSEIGPKIAGTWEATAPGIGYTTGVQHYPVVVSYERGRVYMGGGGGPKVELKPVYGIRKALRFDPIKQKPLPESAHAAKLSLDDIALVTDCIVGIAPQFTWTYGTGARASGGIYSFLSDGAAIGTMWNNAQGAREVLLQR